MERLLLDVRTVSEYEEDGLDEAVNIPLDELDYRIEELDKEIEIDCHCKTGGRAEQAAMILNNYGFKATSVGGLEDAKKLLEE